MYMQIEFMMQPYQVEKDMFLEKYKKRRRKYCSAMCGTRGNKCLENFDIIHRFII